MSCRETEECSVFVWTARKCKKMQENARKYMKISNGFLKTESFRETQMEKQRIETRELSSKKRIRKQRIALFLFGWRENAGKCRKMQENT